MISAGIASPRRSRANVSAVRLVVDMGEPWKQRPLAGLGLNRVRKSLWMFGGISSLNEDCGSPKVNGSRLV